MMKNLFFVFNKVLLLSLVVFLSIFGFGQVNIINTETMYNGTGGTNGDAISTHETNNRFENDALTMSGTGDMRNTNVSSGYTTASGASASGTWNVLLNANTETFIISGINTSSYSSISLSFGIRKSTTAENGSSLAVEVSSDGTTWTALSLPALPTGAGTATWYYRTCTGSIPSTTNLRIRFTSSYGTNLFNIDDVELRGTLASTVDGTIGTNEYGTHTDGQNQQTNGGVITYTRWDDTNLYVGVSGANIAEGFVMYLDKNPIVPVNGGTNADGTLIGYNNYDNTNFAELPFRADAVMYVKSGYREYRTSDGSNGWSAATTAFGNYAENGGTNVREFSIPWSAIGGKPTAFNFYTYITSTGGFVYGQTPTENAGGNIGTSARYSRYYTVSTTTTGSSTPPYSRNSYTFNSAADVTSFGAISCYDFTMNTAGRFLSRTGNTAGDWNIAGNMVIGNGTVYLGSGGGSYGNTNIAGNLNILGGTFDGDQNTGLVTVTGNISIASGGTLKLSGTAPGNLKFAGNWTNSGGTFTPGFRAVFLNGTTTQTITNTTGTETFKFLFVDNSSTLKLATGTNVVVNGVNGLSLLSTAANTIDLNGQTFTLSGGGSLNLNTGARKIISSVTGGIFRITTSLITVSQPGTLTFGETANPTFSTLVLENGFNAGNGAATTLNSVLQINGGGYVTGNTLTYSTGSLLKYNVNGTYNRNFEWNGTASPIGVPYNVQLSNNTTLNYVNGSNLAPQYITNDLTIDSGSSLYMDYGSTTCGGALNVGNNLTSAGNMTLGFASGDDLKIGGNIIFNAGYTFDAKNRAVFFTKAGTQTITASSTPTFHYVVYSAPTTVVQLSAGTNLNITAPNTGNVISFNAATNVFDINGNTLTLGTSGVANTISGSGTFKGSTSSNLTLLGTGSIGDLYFTTGSQNLGTFTLNRQASTVAAVLKTPVTVNTSLVLTNGILDLGALTLTLANAATTSGASSSSYVIADKTIGGKLRKNFANGTTVARSFTFPIGDATSSDSGSQYSPATLNVSTGTFASAYAEMSVDDIKEPNNEATTDYLTRYWSLVGNGITSATYDFTGTYIPATDVAGTEANFISGRYAVTPATWKEGTTVTSPTVSMAGLTTASDGQLTATNEYRFTAGYPFKKAEINIKQGATNYLIGSQYDFGNVGIGSNSDITFTIENLGLENLNLSAATITGGPEYSLLTNYTSPVTAGSNTTFVIRFSPTSAATFTGSISIPNNDVNENPYIINFTGVGTCNLVDFETVSYIKGSYATDDVTINGKIWQLTESLIGNSASDYKIGLNSLRIRDDVTSNSEMQEDFTSGISTISFNYRLYGTDTMNAIYKLEISKDAGNSWYQVGSTITPSSSVQTYNVTINQAGPVRIRIIYDSGTTTSSKRFNIDNISVCSYSTPQEIEVFGNSTTIANGSTAILNKNNTNFGSDYFVGDGTITKTYTVKNLGTGTLTLSNPTISGSTDFTVGTLSSTSLASGASATFTVSFISTTVGSKTATVSISSNDSDENPYTFNVGATVYNYIKCALSSPTVIAQQDFEDSPASPVLAYTTTGTSAVAGGTGYGANRTTPSNMFIGAKSFQVTSNNTSEITFNTVDTSQYQNVNLSFRLGGYGTTTTEGIETGDQVLVSISKDGGVTWVKELKVKGNNNSIFDINTSSGSPISLVYDENTTSEANFGTANNSTNTFSNTFSITDLPSVTSLMVKVKFSFSPNTSGSEKIVLDNFKIEGQLPLSKTYQSGAWLTGAPANNEKAIIDDNLTTGGTNGNIVACECQINAGKTLTVAANSSVTIESNITNNGSIIVESDGNLIQKDDYATFTGNIITARRNAQLKRLDYNYWGSPVANQMLKAFSPGTLNSRFYTYKEDNDTFVVVPSPATTPFAPAKGYAIRASNTAPSTVQTFAGEFKGIPNNGNVSINLDYSGTGNGYNLVANPYPSNMDLDKLYTDNNTDITGTYYFWTNINPNPVMQSSNYPTDGYYNNYAIYNASGGTPATAPATCQDNCVADSETPTNIIKPGQGFIVKTTGASKVLDFNNAQRTNNTSGYFFNKNGTENSVDRYWLQLMTPIQLVNTILVAYKEGSSKAFEGNFDAKLLVDAPDSFYTKLDNSKYSIQGRGYPLDLEDKVDLGVSFHQSGTHIISIPRKEGVFANGQPVYLHDKLLDIYTDLTQNAYTFNTDAGNFADRFEITYKPAGPLSTEDELTKEIVVYTNGLDYVIESPKKLLEVKLLDISGKLISTAMPNKNTLLINNTNLAKGVYVLQIKTSSGITMKKVIK